MIENTQRQDTNSLNGGNPGGLAGEHPAADTEQPAPAIDLERKLGPEKLLEPAKPSSFRVEQVNKGARDSRGEAIDYVYFKRSCYAIYRSEDKVFVQYADDPNSAVDQIKRIAELIPLRDQLQYLVISTDPKALSHREPVASQAGDVAATTPQNCYQWQIAEALRLGLESQTDVAERTLERAIEDIKEIRARAGRKVYLFWAGPLALALAALMMVVGTAVTIGIVGTPLSKVASGVAHLMMASGSGAIGAFLSVAIALRARTVATDGDTVTNGMDAATRILIGAISAGVLYLLLASNILASVQVGDMKLNGAGVTWQIALIVGFAAGFLERLVPDLLEKTENKKT